MRFHVGDVLACSLAGLSHHLGLSSPMKPVPTCEHLCNSGIALDDVQGSLPMPTTHNQQHAVPTILQGPPVAQQPLPALSIQAR